MINCTECLDCLECQTCPAQSMFSILTVCKVLFFTPVIFLGGLVTSVAYDYVTFKEGEDDKKFLVEKTEQDKKSD